MDKFSIITPEDSQIITLNDNAGMAPGEQAIIANDQRAVMWAIYGYAKRYGLPARRVGYAVRPVRMSDRQGIEDAANEDRVSVEGPVIRIAGRLS